MKNLKPAGLALLTAVLLYLSSPGPGYAYLAWPALLPLLSLCRTKKPAAAARWGLFCGFAYHLALLYWIVIVLGKYGNLPLWLTLPALVLLAAYMGFYLAIFSALMSWSMPVVPAVWTAPLLWVSLDYVRGLLFSGFPWQDLGYSQYLFTEVIQIADLAGHHGVTFLIVLVNSLLFTLPASCSSPQSGRKSGKWHHTAPALCLVAAAFVYNHHRLEQVTTAGGEKKAALAVIQGNIEQDQKWLPENTKKALDNYIDLSKKSLAAGHADLLIWPETALPFCPVDHPLFTALIEDLILGNKVNLLCGAPMYTIDDSSGITIYNSGLLATEKGIDDLYFKQHLVPFGEYIPLPGLLPFPRPLVETMGNFSAGNSGRPLTNGIIRAGTLICYESIFPELARKTVRDGANLLVNITNDAWFGRSSAPVQHFSMAVLRAVENRRSLARAANTGISGFIDPAGRIISQSPLFVPFHLNAEIPLVENHSFFSRYGHLFPVTTCLLLVPILLLVRRRKEKNTGVMR